MLVLRLCNSNHRLRVHFKDSQCASRQDIRVPLNAISGVSPDDADLKSLLSACYSLVSWIQRIKIRLVIVQSMLWNIFNQQVSVLSGLKFVGSASVIINMLFSKDIISISSIFNIICNFSQLLNSTFSLLFILFSLWLSLNVYYQRAQLRPKKKGESGESLNKNM